MMLRKTKGCTMIGEPGQRNVKLTHNLLIVDLQTYQNSHSTQKMINGVLVKISMDTGAKKCVEAVYERGMLVKGEPLLINGEAMQAMDTEDLKFLGFEEGNGIAEKVIKR